MCHRGRAQLICNKCLLITIKSQSSKVLKIKSKAHLEGDLTPSVPLTTTPLGQGSTSKAKKVMGKVGNSKDVTGEQQSGTSEAEAVTRSDTCCAAFPPQHDNSRNPAVRDRAVTHAFEAGGGRCGFSRVRVLFGCSARG